MTYPKTLIQSVLLLLTLTACGAFDFQGQYLRLTHDPKADTLELDLVYNGVMARIAHTEEAKKSWGSEEAEHLRKAVNAMEKMAQGAKYFVLLSPVIVFDLDERAELLRSGLQGEKAEESAYHLDMIERITIEEVQVSRDAKDRIQIHQRIQFKGAKQFTAALNKALREGLLTWSEEGGTFTEDSAQMLDAETREAWIKEAGEGKDWVRWDGTSLVISLPMSPGSSARLLHSTYLWIAAQKEEHARLSLVEFLTLISEFHTDDGRLTICINPSEQNAIKLSIPEDEREYATSLTEALEAKGFEFHKPAAKK
ncbi:MAG: hypothetical protein GY930_06180 [bacterium]|nr:hypothetical protein [bacterium]